MNENIPNVYDNTHSLRDEEYRFKIIESINNNHDRTYRANNPKAKGQNRSLEFFRIIPLIQKSEVEHQLPNSTHDYKRMRKIVLGEYFVQIVIRSPDHPGKSSEG